LTQVNKNLTFLIVEENALDMIEKICYLIIRKS